MRLATNAFSSGYVFAAEQKTYDSRGRWQNHAYGQWTSPAQYILPSCWMVGLRSRPEIGKLGIDAMRNASTLMEGDIRLSPDGRFILVETKLEDEAWGCDLLEDEDGRPSPAGDPGCHGLKLPGAALKRMPVIRATNEDCNSSSAETRRRGRHRTSISGS